MHGIMSHIDWHLFFSVLLTHIQCLMEKMRISARFARHPLGLEPRVSVVLLLSFKGWKERGGLACPLWNMPFFIFSLSFAAGRRS